MASKVNTKFVVLLATVLVLLAGVVIGVGYTALRKSGESLMAEGDKFLAAGEIDKAVTAYARGVAKDQRNVEWIKKWLAAMEKSIPTPRQRYIEQYQGQYMLALQGLSQADSASVESQRRLLDETYQRLLLVNAGQNGWENLVRSTDEVLARFMGDEKGKNILRRYKGLARGGLVAIGTELRAEDRAAAYEDLEAALRGDPADADALVAWATLKNDEADRLRRKDETAKADEMIGQIRDRLLAFVKANAPAATAQMALLRVEFGVTARQQQGQFTLRTLAEANRELFDATVKAFNDTPADQLTPPAAIGLATMLMTAREGGDAEARTLLQRVLDARKDSATLMLGWGKLEAGRGEFDRARDLMEKIVALPERPLSLEGVLLQDVQADAIRSLADVAFARWEREQDSAKREAFAGEAKKRRDEFVSKVGEDNNSTLALDARLAFIANDMDRARTLLSRYNERTSQTDLQSLNLEAQVALRSQNVGLAQERFERVLQLDPGNMGALVALGQIEQSKRNWAAASRYLCLAAQLRPDDEGLKQQCEATTAMKERQERSPTAADGAELQFRDPAMKVLTEAQAKLGGISPDPKAAVEILKNGIAELAKDAKTAKDPRLAQTLVRLQLSMGDRAAALASIREAKAAHPDEKWFVNAERDIDVADPMQAELDQIAKAQASDLEKSLARFDTYLRYGKEAEAKTALGDAAKLAPEDPRVVDRLFREALTAKNREEMDRLVALAESKNLDAVNGLWYRARRAVVLDNFEEAVPMLREVTEKDKNNPDPWRLLGAVHLRSRNFDAAIDALDRAVKIRPQDVASINAYIEAMMRAQRTGDALKFARESEQFASADPQYRELRLQLEADAPGGDRQVALEARRKRRAEAPTDRTNNAQLVALLVGERQWDEARKILDEISPKDGKPDPMVVGLEAIWWTRQALRESGGLDAAKLAEARKVYDAFFAAIPKDQQRTQFYSNAARELAFVGDIEGSIEYLKRGREFQDAKLMEMDRELGDLYFRLGRFEDAIGSYRALLTAGSPNPDFLVDKRIIECMLQLKRYSEVDAEIARMGPDAQKDPTVLLLASQAAADQADTAKARRLADQAIAAAAAAGKPSVVAFMRRAELNAQDPALRKDAVKDLEDAIRIEPTNVTARALLANMLLQDGEYDKALGVVREAVAANPYAEPMRETLVDLLVMRQRYAEAFDVIDAAVKLNDEGVKWRIVGGDVASQAGNWILAERYFGEVFKRVPRADIAMKLVNAQLQQSPPRCTQATEVLSTRALQTDRNMVLVLGRARASMACRKAAEALDDVKKAQAMFDQNNPDDVNMFFQGFGQVWPDLKDQLNALSRMERDKPFADWMKLQASAVRLRDESLRSGVEKELVELASKTQDNAVRISVYKLLGSTSYGAKQWERAVEMFRKGLEVNPGDVELNNNIAFTLAKQLGRASEALPFAQKAAEAQPNNPTILDSLGVVQLEMKSFEDAERTLSRALALATQDTDRAAILIHLANARVELKRSRDAQELLDKAREVMDNNQVVKRAWEEDLKKVQKLLDAN
jgi:tetratricopeptide (TPR) repeat protein